MRRRGWRGATRFEMPIYEYECKGCGHRFEAIRPLGDRSRKLACPDCGKTAATRLPSVFAASSGGDACPSAPVCGSSGFS